MDRLSEDELTSMVYLLVLAGHETTAGLISNGVRALLTHPGQLARLRPEPGMLPGVVEEILRFDSPTQSALPNFASAPVDVAGRRSPPATWCLSLCWPRTGTRTGSPSPISSTSPVTSRVI